MLTISQSRQIHKSIIEDGFLAAGNLIASLHGQDESIQTDQEGLQVCRDLFQHMLDNDLYLHAATIQWGPDMFNTEPESVTRVFKAVAGHSMCLLQGAASMSKTYSAGAWLLLDYLRDPYFTTVKLAAVSEDHLRKNLYAHVCTLYRSLSIPVDYDIAFRDADLWMGIREAGMEFGISGIAFKQSQETSGQFKGYKAKPVRKIPHPKFGVMSRLRVLLDEAQNVPGGPFQDFNSLMASVTGEDMVKIICAYNPEEQSRIVVQMAEPDEGWTIEGMEKLYDWTSKAGWRVCRLDAALSENVIQRKDIFIGLQTYTGYLKYLQAGGDSSPRYFCFGRGWPPVKGSVNTIIPPEWVQSQRGEATFIENPVSLASVDLAFTGKDRAIMAIGRWGKASGWTDHIGKWHEFKDRVNVALARPRHLLQIDQLLPMAFSEDTVKMSEEIMGRCKMLQITPANCCVDATGYGFGVLGHLHKVWGDVFGIAWNEKATPNRMVAEDLAGADQQVTGVMSEMWWTFRRWLDPVCCAVLINPVIPNQPINTQLTSRRHRFAKAGKISVESKDEYKARNAGKSPDESDAIIMMPHLVRKNFPVLPGLVEQYAPKEDVNDDIPFTSVKHESEVFSEAYNDDSMSSDPSDKDND